MAWIPSWLEKLYENKLQMFKNKICLDPAWKGTHEEKKISAYSMTGTYETHMSQG